MNNWIDLTNFAIASGGLVISTLGLILAIAIKNIEAWKKKYFLVLFTILFAYILSDLISQISLSLLGSDHIWLSKAAIFFESFFSSIAMPMLMMLLLHDTGETPAKSRSFYVVSALWSIYLIMLISAQYSKSFYYITDSNVYHRGPLYPVLLIPPVLLMAVNLITLIRKRHAISGRYLLALLLYILLPLICMLIQMWLYGLLLIVLGTSVSSLVLFAFILNEQNEKHILQQKENEKQRTSIAVMQMRPHFIYNVMTSIYYLCRQEPEKAQQVILDFSSYLRKNFTAIAKEDTIPFTEELEHTRAYLAVEQTRFEDRLFVDFDIPHVMFRLPPLTLQPIVENAVKHGIDPELQPLKISVSTRESKSGSMIVITDNGPGFEKTDHGAAPHIALDNIRERLEMMCGGTLTIDSCDSNGTTVTLYIPM